MVKLRQFNANKIGGEIYLTEVAKGGHYRAKSRDEIMSCLTVLGFQSTTAEVRINSKWNPLCRDMRHNSNRTKKPMHISSSSDKHTPAFLALFVNREAK